MESSEASGQLELSQAASSESTGRSVNGSNKAKEKAAASSVVMYSQLNNLARPLDRLHRPVSEVDDDKYHELIMGLQVPIEDTVDYSAEEKTHQARDEAGQQSFSFAAPLHKGKAAATAKGQVKSTKGYVQASPRRLLVRPMILLWLTAVVASGIVAGYFGASYLLPFSGIGPNSQSAVSEQTKAQWQKAQAQWECVLHQYQAQQISNNKAKGDQSSCQN